MIHFDWPLLLLALPLPLLAWRLLRPAAVAEEAALRVPDLSRFAIRGEGKLDKLVQPRHRLWMGVLAWVLLVLAAARPVWVGDAIELPINGRDLMLVVDLSGSMQTEDFEIGGKQMNRLD